MQGGKARFVVLRQMVTVPVGPITPGGATPPDRMPTLGPTSAEMVTLPLGLITNSFVEGDNGARTLSTCAG